MEDPAFVKRFREAERPGLYCRVIEQGYVHVGDQVMLKRYMGENLKERDGGTEVTILFYRKASVCFAGSAGLQLPLSQPPKIATRLVTGNVIGARCT
jgi:hypothetical protein